MTTPLLCETVTGHSTAELVAARDAVTIGEMVELRLDGVGDLDVEAALHGRRLPVVVTCRPAWEGGRFEGREEERARILARALELGAEFVDVEWRAVSQSMAAGFDEVIRRAPTRVVVSSHDFEGVPADLDDRVKAMRSLGAGAIKVAVMASRLTDTLPLKRIAATGDAIVIGMGEAGVPSRLLAARYGSRWTYAGNAVAPGQLPAERMAEDFHFFRVGPVTRIFGVVGSNALHSLSPAMHNAAFEVAGIDAVYVPLRAADFEDFLSYASAMNVEGASVTIPFKLDALRASERSDSLTQSVGAANTLRREGQGWEATNTDVDGFLDPLDAVFGARIRDARAAVLGAGGAARAVVVALVKRGARVTVYARRPDQAQELAQSLGADARHWPPAPGSWDVLVNCTPAGGAGRRAESPLPPELVAGPLVYDLTYGQGPSALLREAREAGSLTIDGLPMLIAQAERQFEWWTGQRPEPGVMAAAARRRIGTPMHSDSRATEPRSRGVHK
jgi:3-dehydroquinate dehydratase / shikimate dehydrogenase